ncbi:MAG: copper-binding protein [Nitrosomonadales bacterium]|nr:copper-binding protein [Nitrosomonadales bacterium]
MNKLTLAFFFALLATSALARAASNEHEQHHDASSQQTQQAATHIGAGVLKAINAKDGKVQIAHEPIAALGWPSMTMWFMLHDPLPQGLKAGDAVRFELVQGEKKQWVIVNISHK